jgi:hypothetical protein
MMNISCLQVDFWAQLSWVERALPLAGGSLRGFQSGISDILGPAIACSLTAGFFEWHGCRAGEAPMSQVFTDYVRSLDPAGEPPDREAFERALKALRRELRRELERRGLWDSSPRYVGILGHERWPGPEGAPKGGAIEELLADAYEFIFVARLRNLLAHLEVKPQIEGLVRLNVRHLLHEAQRKHDPLGYRVYQILHAAIRQAVERGGLHIAVGGPAIRNETVLTFRPETNSGSLPPAQLEETVHRWNDDLLPGLVTARGKIREELVTDLRGRIEGLADARIEGFTFRELIDPLKHDARVRWRALHGLGGEEIGFEGAGADEDETPRVVPLVHPDTSVEDDQHLSRLMECVEREVDDADETPTGKEYLGTLWDFLRTWVSEPHAELPSRRRQAALLDIPRNRMPDLYRTLQELVARCRRAIATKATVNSSGAIELSEDGPGGPGAGSSGSGLEGAMNEPTNRLEALRRQTGEARAAVESALRPRPDDAPRPGGLYLLPATAELPVEWAVLEAGPGIARPLLVPADAQPFVGRADLAVPSDEPCGPLALRCGFAVRVQETAYEPQTWKRTGSLTPETLALTRQRQREIAAGAGPPPSRRFADDDPEYRNWVSEVLEPARAALEALDPGSEVLPFRARSSRSSPLGNPWAVAASVLLVVSIGSLGGLWWQHRELAELRRVGREPLVDFESRPVSADLRGPERIVIRKGTRHLLLFLNLPDEAIGAESYRLVFSRLGAGRAREKIWTRDQVPVSEAQVLVALPTVELTSGEYQLRLEERDDTEVATYPIEIVREEPDR